MKSDAETVKELLNGTMLYQPTQDKVGISAENAVVKDIVAQFNSGI